MNSAAIGVERLVGWSGRCFKYRIGYAVASAGKSGGSCIDARDRLTVGQSVLERVDAVEDNEAWTRVVRFMSQ